MAIFGAAISAGSIVGLTLSPYLLKAIGNVYLLLTVSALMVTAYAVTNIVLEESVIGAAEPSVVSIFDISHVKEMGQECFKGRPNHGRAQILLLASSNSLLLFIVNGIDGREYGYTREKLHWSLKDYNTYSAVNTFISFFGAFLILMLLQKMLSVSDLILAIVSLFSGIAGYFIKAFAVTSWNMYLAATISIPKGLSTFLIRSFLTKILSPDVVAKVFTLMSALDALCPLLAPVLFNSLYALSISTFPGGIYLLGNGIAVICTIMLGFVQYYRRKVATTYQILPSEETLSVN